MAQKIRTRRGGLLAMTPSPIEQPAVPVEAGIREELVARIRREIAEGTYETNDKLAIALDRMIDDVA